MKVIYLMYEDQELLYAEDQDERANFQPIANNTTSILAGDEEEIRWKKSEHDTALEDIKIKNKNKKDQTLSKGHWKDTWKSKPTNITKVECSGIPQDSSATTSDPAFFAYDIIYKIAGDNKKHELDPRIQFP